MDKSRIFFIFVVIFSFLLFFLTGDFKIAVFMSLFFLAIFYYLTNNLLFSLISIILISSQFNFIGKYYEFEVASKDEHVYESFEEGINDFYGLGLAELYSFGAGVLLLRMRLKKNAGDKYKITFFKNDFSKIIFYSWFLFLLISLLSSIYNSFFPEFSLYYVFSYSKWLVLFLAGIILLRLNSSIRRNFMLVFLAILSFQLFLGFYQISMHFSGNEEFMPFNYSYSVPEEEFMFIPRVSGSFGHANDYAFVLIKLIIIFLVFNYLKLNSVLSKSLVFFTFLMIAFSQSRTIWIAIFFSILYLSLIYKNVFKDEFRKMFKIISTNRLTFFSSTFLVATLLILFIPRIMNSKYFFDEYGGASLRKNMIEEGIEAFIQKPWLGYGSETNLRVMFDSFPNGYVREFPFSIHNFYLKILLDSGVIGLLLFIIPFYTLIRNFFSNRKINNFDKFRFELLTICCIICLFYYSFQPSNLRTDFVFILPIFILANYLLEKDYDKKNK